MSTKKNSNDDLKIEFEEWLEENDYVAISEAYYECPGNHLWFEDDVYKIYEEETSNGKK